MRKKDMLRRGLIKTHRTIIDITLIVIIIVVLIYFRHIMRVTTVIFISFWPLFLLCDIFFTWIPTSVLSKEQREQIKSIIFCSKSGEETNLGTAEIEQFKTLFQKRISYLTEEDKALTGIGFKILLEEDTLCLFQSKRRTNCFFYMWENGNSNLREIIDFNEHEMKIVEHIIRMYDC